MTTVDSETPLRTPPAPSPSQVLFLQSISEYPAVSLLLSTTPAGQMLPVDRGRLLALLRQAEERLASEGLGQPLIDRLEQLVDRASAAATARAVAIYASEAASALLTLPVSVEDRVVIDPTFATRDLVRALHRTPRHVVLVLTSRDARLFDGAGGHLTPDPTGAFPMRLDSDRGGEDPSRPSLKDSHVAAFLRRVDRALGTYLRLHPAPLVVVGPDRVVSSFLDLSRNLGRLAGTLPSNLATASLDVLADRIRPVLEQYLRSREDEALGLLDRRIGADRAVSGMPAAWLAARSERPEMLVVEEGLFYPARISLDGDHLARADDVDHPEVIDDAVDELIELVLDRGGWVALVRDGVLRTHGGVALTIRART